MELTINMQDAYLFDKAMRIKEYQRANEPFNSAKISNELDKLNPHFEGNRELRIDYRPHKMQFSEVVKRAFSTNFIRGLMP